MQTRWALFWCTCLMLCPLAVSAQQNTNTLGSFPRSNAPAKPDTRPFNKRDFTGIWRGDKYIYSATHMPEFTPEGKKKFDSYKPSYGPRAIPPAQGNDPVGECNPLGLIRLLLYDPSPMEIVQTPTRMMQFFEWTWDHRDVWIDGRSQAKVDEYLPRFNGYSVGKWDGDTLVVTTVGFDDRGWVDHFGNPISDQAKLEERWTRTDYSTLELRMTITDPKIYAQPWPSDVDHFRKISAADISAGVGWDSLAEDRCVPLDEVDTYDKQVRDPAGGK